jgi:hypothetical protein
MVAFDGVYIPALFLTGSAGKSAEGPARAQAATQRLLAQWPAQHTALRALFPADNAWASTLGKVDEQLTSAARLVAAQQWAPSHEALEPVRELLAHARQTRGWTDYLPDRFTAFHGPMEHLSGVGSVDRAAMRQQFNQALALWQALQSQPIEPAEWGLSAARAAQLRQGLSDETAALARLDQALREAGDAAIVQAAQAIKPPFIRAYTALGWAPNESPELPR